MTTTLAESVTEQLKDRLSKSESRPRRLMLAAGDAELLTRINDAFPKIPMIDCPQRNWNLAGGEPLEAILYAVREGVSEIILLGNSLAFSDNADAYQPAAMQRAQNAAKERQKAEIHFVQQVTALLGHPILAKLVKDEELAIKPVFYRAEANLFTVFRPQSGQFIPLA